MKVLFFFASLLVLFSAKSATLNESLVRSGKKHAIYGNKNLKKNISAKGEKKEYSTLIFNNQEVKYNLDIAKPTTLSEFNISKNNISAVIFNSYKDQPTPYPGIITNTAECPAKFKPISLQLKVKNADIFIIKSLVGKNFNYGICEDKSVVYSSCAAFYFEEKTSQYFKLNVYTKPQKDCSLVVRNFFENLTDL